MYYSLIKKLAAESDLGFSPQSEIGLGSAVAIGGPLTTLQLLRDARKPVKAAYEIPRTKFLIDMLRKNKKIGLLTGLGSVAVGLPLLYHGITRLNKKKKNKIGGNDV